MTIIELGLIQEYEVEEGERRIVFLRDDEAAAVTMDDARFVNQPCQTEKLIREPQYEKCRSQQINRKQDFDSSETGGVLRRFIKHDVWNGADGPCSQGRGQVEQRNSKGNQQGRHQIESVQ